MGFLQALLRRPTFRSNAHSCAPAGVARAESPRRARGLARRCWQVVRPLTLTAVAAVAFAALLHWHHRRFEDGLVRNVQEYQADLARSTAASMGKSFAGVQRSLAILAGQPALREPSPETAELLHLFRGEHEDLVEWVQLADSSGEVLLTSRARKASSSAVGEQALAQVHVDIPSAGSPPARLTASVNVRKLAAKCLPGAADMRRGSCWVVSSSGAVVHGADALLSDSLARRMGLLCAAEGRSGVDTLPGGDGRGGADLVAFTPVLLGHRRFAIVVAAPKADISVPLAAHERLTYTLIAALAVLYFATGYVAHRGETARVRLLEKRRGEAERASRAKGIFLAKMSHEIRTPMNGILGMTSRLLADDLSEHQRHCLNVIQDSSDALLTVLNDVLDFSKIESGKLELSPAPFDLRPCLQRGIAAVEPLAATKGLALDWRVDGNVPDQLVADAGRLRQVIANLLTNALKYTDNGRVDLNVSLESMDADRVCAHFAVRDTGPGVTAEQAERLFRPFEQGQQGAYHPQPGVGLGLAIARELVERMDGRIWAEGTPGQGSTFHFTATFGRARVRPASAAATPRTAGRRALVLCDNEELARSVCDPLRRMGMVIRRPPGPEQLLAEARAAEGDAVHVVVLQADQQGGGFGLARRVRDLAGRESTVVAIIAATGLRGDAARCQEAGADVYLSGAVEEAVFCDAIRAALARPALCGHDGDRPLITRFSLAEERRHLRILLAEDNPVNREVAALLLGDWGHTVVFAENGREVLDRMEIEEFDLVLMDVQMPGINGLEATREIRRLEEHTARHVPIIAMTAHAMIEHRRECIEAGMDGYVSKPVRPEDLSRAISERMAWGEPPETPTSMEGPGPPRCFDEAKALRHVGGSLEGLRRVASIFRDNCPAMLARLREASAEEDVEQLRAAIHMMKGSLGLLATEAAMRPLWALASTGKQGKWRSARRHYDELSETMDRLLWEIASREEHQPCES